jgi:hypothetical protein
MKKIILVSIIYFLTNSCGTPKKNYVPKFIDTSNYNLKQAFPNNYLKVKPGCVEVGKFNELKRYLKENCKIDIDSAGTINIFYTMPKSKCSTDIYHNDYYFTKNLPDNFGNCTIVHSYDYTKLNNPLLLLKYDKDNINEKWLNDDKGFIYNLFLIDENKTHCEALLTISKDRSYLLDWEYFSPQTFNAFGNELSKYKCE